jgi:hypothetical protein
MEGEFIDQGRGLKHPGQRQGLIFKFIHRL